MVGGKLYVCIYRYICVYIYVYTYIRMYVCVCVCVHLCRYVHASVVDSGDEDDRDSQWWGVSSMCAYTDIMCVYIYIYICIYMRVCVYVYICVIASM